MSLFSKKETTPNPKKNTRKTPSTRQKPTPPTRPQLGERLLSNTQETIHQSSKAAQASEELLTLMKGGDREENPDPIQLLQDTLSQLVELELSNAKRLTAIETVLKRSMRSSKNPPPHTSR